MEQPIFTVIQTLIIAIVTGIVGMIIPFIFPKKRDRDSIPPLYPDAPLHLAHAVEKLNLETKLNIATKEKMELQEKLSDLANKRRDTSWLPKEVLSNEEKIKSHFGIFAPTTSFNMDLGYRTLEQQERLRKATTALEFGKRIHEEFLETKGRLKDKFKKYTYTKPVTFDSIRYAINNLKNNMKTEQLVNHLKSLGAVNIKDGLAPNTDYAEIQFHIKKDSIELPSLPRIVEAKQIEEDDWERVKLVYSTGKIERFPYLGIVSVMNSEHSKWFGFIREIPKQILPTETCWLEEPFKIQVRDTLQEGWKVKLLIGYKQGEKCPYLVRSEVGDITSYKEARLIE